MTERLARVACALLLASACAARASAQGGESLTTKAGVLSIVRTSEEELKWELRLGARTLLRTEGESWVHFEAVFPNLSQGEVVVVSFGSGGNACPAQFRVVRVVSAEKVDVSDEFGDCADSPTITLKQLPEEELTFGFPGYYQLWQSREPGFRRPPPTTYVYRKGVLTELKAPARKKG
ncbi:MAG TPA: hypothetical protein VGX48_23620 [Pyrinomonadaceae bacterium]|jgi:hypothetical protein|nr:hypothetical protein [Pyrinomonadaceae bacterium]